MNCAKCGTEMRDMGHWPDTNMINVFNQWHCLDCNLYAKQQVPFKLEVQSDGSWKEVVA